MRRDEDLDTDALELDEDVDEGPEEFRVEICLRFIPEEDRALKQGSVLNQEPEQPQLPHAFGEKGELQIALPVAEEELLVLDGDLSRDRLLQGLEQPTALPVRRPARDGKVGAVEDVRVDLLEVDFTLRIQRTETGRVGEHLLYRDVDAPDGVARPGRRAGDGGRVRNRGVVGERRPELHLVAVHLHRAPGAPLLPPDQAPQSSAGRQEETHQLQREGSPGLADVAGGIGDLHQMGLAGSVGTHDDVDAARRHEVELPEGREALELQPGNGHGSLRVGRRMSFTTPSCRPPHAGTVQAHRADSVSWRLLAAAEPDITPIVPDARAPARRRSAARPGRRTGSGPFLDAGWRCNDVVDRGTASANPWILIQ